MSYKRIIIRYFSFLFVFNLAFLFYSLPIIAQESIAKDVVDTDSALGDEKENSKDSIEDVQDTINDGLLEDVDKSEDGSAPPSDDAEGRSFQNEQVLSSDDEPVLPFQDEELNSNVTRIVQTIEKNNITNMPRIKLDQDIFLFLCGFGEAKFVWTHSVEFFTDHVNNIMQAPVFIQEANLSLLLLMKNRWYFGVNYKEKIYDSSLYLGYIDIENSVKKHIRLGNKGITFASIYPFIKGEASNLAPGLSASFEGEKWRLDSVIRYDSSKKEKRVFYGKNELIENHLS